MVPDLCQTVPAVRLYHVPDPEQGHVGPHGRRSPGHQHGRPQVCAGQGQGGHTRVPVLGDRVHHHGPQRQLHDHGAQERGGLSAALLHVRDQSEGGYWSPDCQLLPEPRLLAQTRVRESEEKGKI